MKIILFSSYCCSEFNQFRHFSSSTLLSADPASISTEQNNKSGPNICPLSKNFLEIQTTSFPSLFSIVNGCYIPCVVTILRDWPGSNFYQIFLSGEFQLWKRNHLRTILYSKQILKGKMNTPLSWKGVRKWKHSFAVLEKEGPLRCHYNKLQSTLEFTFHPYTQTWSLYILSLHT